MTKSNGYRFIAGDSGELTASVKRIIVVHVKVVKLPMIGVPIPIILYWYEDNTGGESRGGVKIHVENIGVIPLFMTYDDTKFKPVNGLDTTELIKRTYSDRYVYINAMLSWINKSGYPTYPVLLRGLYYGDRVMGSLRQWSHGYNKWRNNQSRES